MASCWKCKSRSKICSNWRLYGKSFLKFLNEKAINENFSFYQFTQPNCLSLNNFTNTYKFGIEGYDNCVNLYNKALEKSANLNIPLIYSSFWGMT